MADTVLEQVSVIMQPQADSGLTEDFIMPLPSLTQATSPGIVYVSFTRDIPEEYPVASFQCVLKFISKEVDPTSGEPEEEGYEDEYQLEDVELASGGDYILPNYASFAAEWDRLREGATATETFALSAMESIKGMFLLCPQLAYTLMRGGLILFSGMRLDYRDPQYGSVGWHGEPDLLLYTHTAVVRTGDWWWREGSCSLSYDILGERGGNTTTGRARGEARSMQSGGCCYRWLMLRLCCLMCFYS